VHNIKSHEEGQQEPLIKNDFPHDLGDTHEIVMAWVKTAVFPTLMCIIGTLLMMQIGGFKEDFGGIKNDIKEMKAQINEISRNPMLQAKKEEFISKAEFTIYQEFRNKQMDDMKTVVKDGLDQMRIEIRNLPLYKKEWQSK
jgi:hypothetical protein